MLEKNQCLPQFHQLIIREMLYKILGKQNGREEVDREAIEKPVKKQPCFETKATTSSNASEK